MDLGGSVEPARGCLGTSSSVSCGRCSCTRFLVGEGSLRSSKPSPELASSSSSGGALGGRCGELDHSLTDATWAGGYPPTPTRAVSRQLTVCFNRASDAYIEAGEVGYGSG
jgi:hypothetical protein